VAACRARDLKEYRKPLLLIKLEHCRPEHLLSTYYVEQTAQLDGFDRGMELIETGSLIDYRSGINVPRLNI